MNHISINDYLSLYLDKKNSLISNLANFTAVIYEMIEDLNWVGFYLYNGKTLELGPFQGKPAVTQIEMGQGVCGVSAEKRKILIVDDVHQFEGHIACDGASNSEIVIPVIKNKQLIGVLDIDSPRMARFDEETAKTIKENLDFLFDFC